MVKGIDTEISKVDRVPSACAPELPAVALIAGLFFWLLSLYLHKLKSDGDPKKQAAPIALPSTTGTAFTITPEGRHNGKLLNNNKNEIRARKKNKIGGFAACSHLHPIRIQPLQKTKKRFQQIL